MLFGRRRRALNLFDRLNLADDFTVDDLVEATGAHTGRPIHVMDFSPDHPALLANASACWEKHADHDRLYRDPRVGQYELRFATAHECAHAGLKHTIPKELVASAFPDFRPDVVQDACGLFRHGYGTSQERDAEVFADLIMQAMD